MNSDERRTEFLRLRAEIKAATDAFDEHVSQYKAWQKDETGQGPEKPWGGDAFEQAERLHQLKRGADNAMLAFLAGAPVLDK